VKRTVTWPETIWVAGSSWNVVEYNNGKQAVVSVLAGTRLTAIFDKGGHISGSAGCNEFNGPVKTTPPKIVVGPLSATRKSCSTPAGVMEQEAGYLAGPDLEAEPVHGRGPPVPFGQALYGDHLTSFRHASRVPGTRGACPGQHARDGHRSQECG